MYIANINGKNHRLNDIRDVISFIFSIPLKHGTYTPIDVMKENYKEAVAVTCEFLSLVREDRVKAGMKGGELGSITRLITRLTDFKEYIEGTNSVHRLNAQVYNLVLSYEGSGLLNGFGMSNRHGDRVIGNPETHSILPPEIKKKRV